MRLEAPGPSKSVVGYAPNVQLLASSYVTEGPLGSLWHQGPVVTATYVTSITLPPACRFTIYGSSMRDLYIDR